MKVYYRENQLYPATETFKDNTINANPDGWTISNDENCTSIVIATLDGHNNVLQLYDNSGTGNCDLKKSFTGMTYGTIEFYIRVSDATLESSVLFQCSSTWVLALRIDADKFQYYDSAWHDVGLAAADDTWYHIRIDFELTAGTYQSLAEDKWHVYINGNHYGDYAANSQVSVNEFRPYTQNADTAYYFYIDAIGYSWDTEYTVGDNWQDYMFREVTGIKAYPEVTSALDTEGFCSVVLQYDIDDMYSDWYSRNFIDMLVTDRITAGDYYSASAENILFRGYLVNKVFHSSKETQTLTLYIAGLSRVLEWETFNKNFIYAQGTIAVVCPGGVAKRLTLQDSGSNPFTWDTNQFAHEADFGILIEDNTSGTTPTTWTVTAVEDNGTSEYENLNAADWAAPLTDFEKNYDELETASYLEEYLTVDGASIDHTHYIKKIEFGYRWGVYYNCAVNVHVNITAKLQVQKSGDWQDIGVIHISETKASSSPRYIWTGQGIDTDGNLVADYTIEDTNAELINFFTTDGGGDYDGMSGVRIWLVGTSSGPAWFGILGDYFSATVYDNTYDIIPIMKTITANGASTIDNEDTDWDTTGVAAGDSFMIGYRTALVVPQIAEKIGMNIDIGTTTTADQTFNIDPNADTATNQWTRSGGADDHYTYVDDLGMGTWLYVVNGDASEVEIFDMETDLLGDSHMGLVTQLAIKLYLGYTNTPSNDMTVCYSIDGGSTWSSNSTITFSAPAAGHLYTCTWSSLTLTQYDLDALQIKVTAPGTIDVGDVVTWYYVYVTVTYDQVNWVMTKYIAHNFAGTYCKEAVDFIKNVEGGYLIEDYENNRLKLLKESEFEDSTNDFTSADYDWDWTFEDQCNQFKEVQLYGNKTRNIYVFARDETTTNTSPMIKQIVDDRVMTAADGQEIVDEMLTTLDSKRPSFILTFKTVQANLKVGTTADNTFTRPTIAQATYPIRKIQRSKVGDVIKTIVYFGLGESPIEEKLGKNIRDIAWLARGAQTRILNE